MYFGGRKGRKIDRHSVGDFPVTLTIHVLDDMKASKEMGGAPTEQNAYLSMSMFLFSCGTFGDGQPHKSIRIVIIATVYHIDKILC